MSSCSRFGQLDEPAPVDERGDRGQSAADQQRRLEATPAPDQEGGQRDGEDDPGGLHSIAPHGATAIGRGLRSWSRAAAARADSRSPNRPTTVGPDPQTSARRAPTPRAARSASAISGHSERAAGSRSLTMSSSGRSTAAVETSRRRAARSSGLAWQAQAIGLAEDVSRRELRGRREDENAVRRRSRQRREPLADAGGQVAPRADLRGDVGAELGRDRAQQAVVVDTRRPRRQA